MGYFDVVADDNFHTMPELFICNVHTPFWLEILKTSVEIHRITAVRNEFAVGNLRAPYESHEPHVEQRSMNAILLQTIV